MNQYKNQLISKLNFFFKETHPVLNFDSKTNFTIKAQFSLFYILFQHRCEKVDDIPWEMFMVIVKVLQEEQKISKGKKN